jgi:hypothetical protein
MQLTEESIDTAINAAYTLIHNLEEAAGYGTHDSDHVKVQQAIAAFAIDMRQAGYTL